MKALSSSISEEDFVYFAKLKGAGEGRIMTAYVLRNAILPQVTVLAAANRRHLQWSADYRNPLWLSRLGHDHL